MNIPLLIFIVLSLSLVLGFYWGRGFNVRKARDVSSTLEKIFKPRDQIYTWIGGYIGFYAEYKTNGFKKVEVTFTMLPRQSWLYLPFVWLLGKRDKINILFRTASKKLPDLHLVKSSFKEDIPENKNYQIKKMRLGNKIFKIYNLSEEDLLRLNPEVIPFKERLLRVSFTPETGVVYFSIKAQDTSRLAEDLGWILNFTKKIK